MVRHFSSTLIGADQNKQKQKSQVKFIIGGNYQQLLQVGSQPFEC